jgi:hypothetical protein
MHSRDSGMRRPCPQTFEGRSAPATGYRGRIFTSLKELPDGRL